MSRYKAYRNILFRIDYKMMTRDGTIEKSKSGGIKDVLLPGKTGEWPIDLVFGEPPKDIKTSLIKADAADPAGITVHDNDQRKNSVVPVISSEKLTESDATKKPAEQATSLPQSGPASPANSAVK
jgi:hypothetical protein